MLEPIKYTTVSQICIRDLIFYSAEKHEEVLQFCADNAITFVPSSDRISCYKLVNGEFVLFRDIPDELICFPTDFIFTDGMIEKFRNGNHDEVLFVMEDDLIKGVVHIVDYNNDNLYVEIFRMLLKFENNLRQLLIKSGYTNNDFMKWMGEKAKYNKYYEVSYDKMMQQHAVEKRENSNPFQTFLLRDLVMFATIKKLFDRNEINLDKITILRNWIAHSKDVISINPNSDHPVYNIEGLKVFISSVRAFFRSYDYLEMKLNEVSGRR